VTRKEKGIQTTLALEKSQILQLKLAKFGAEQPQD